MPKNNKIKILCLLIIGIVFLYIYGPIAFMKDGLVTRQGVNSFDELYELGPARRHKCENGTRIYIVYFGWSAPKVKKEIVYQKNEETQKQIVDVDTQKIIPGLYYVTLRQTIGSDYYSDKYIHMVMFHGIQKVLYTELKQEKNIIL